jgi:hypothetical protein
VNRDQLAGDETASDFLPSARRAMRMAVEIASDPQADPLQVDRAHLWIAIAHELRTGERPMASASIPMPRPLERIEPEPPSFDRLTVIHDRPEHQRGSLLPCGNCGHAIELLMPDDSSDPYWAHSITSQQVCPVSAPDQTHTFAAPKLDHRG